MSGTPVEVRRTGRSGYVATNGRGGSVPIASEGVADAFTPGELLLAAVAGCSGLTVENLLTRRLGETAEVSLHADRSKAPEDPQKFSSIHVSFDVDLSAIEDETERGKLADALVRAVERSCTVGRTVQQGTPIDLEPPR